MSKRYIYPNLEIQQTEDRILLGGGTEITKISTAYIETWVRKKYRGKWYRVLIIKNCEYRSTYHSNAEMERNAAEFTKTFKDMLILTIKQVHHEAYKMVSLYKIQPGVKDNYRNDINPLDEDQREEIKRIKDELCLTLN